MSKQQIDWNVENAEIFNIARNAEEQEFQKMIDEGYTFAVGNCMMWDVCGFAVVKFNDRRSRVYKSYKSYMKKSFDLDIDENFDYPCSLRQEKRVNVAMANAVASYLNNKFGKCVYVRSWTD